MDIVIRDRVQNGAQNAPYQADILRLIQPLSVSKTSSSAWDFVPLSALQAPPQQLQVADIVGPAPGLGNDVIDLQVAHLEVRLASVAVAAPGDRAPGPLSPPTITQGDVGKIDGPGRPERKC